MSTAAAAASAATIAAAANRPAAELEPRPLGNSSQGTAVPGGVSPTTAARVAGVGYVALYLLAIGANFVVLEGLVDRDDAGATLSSIRDSLGLFRLGTIGFLAIFVLDVVIAWALHVLLADHDRELSRLAAWSRLAYTVFLGIGVVFFWRVIDLVASPGGRSDAALATEVLSAVESFDAAWLVGLAAFGLHLGVLAAILFRTDLAPRPMAWLLAIAGFAYGVDTVAHIALADYDRFAGAFLAFVAVPSMVGEGWFGLWLLTRASRRTTAAGPEADAGSHVGTRADAGSSSPSLSSLTLSTQRPSRA